MGRIVYVPLATAGAAEEAVDVTAAADGPTNQGLGPLEIAPLAPRRATDQGTSAPTPRAHAYLIKSARGWGVVHQSKTDPGLV